MYSFAIVENKKAVLSEQPFDQTKHNMKGYNWCLPLNRLKSHLSENEKQDLGVSVFHTFSNCLLHA
ncbi:hypothetical protein C943_02002 [Mariniradius saccharolyticus AK6]|uniref:Uncharacterized protein n=1 Tax=Mariniradius saccharolyticus AK6 TaxID=1239962 RepID=M7Y3D4_9BACT|nr:hypothetical protein C943_02002 [Mariniradius saccharolyticus AK6]